jgi:hypothetical protein
MVSCRFSLDLPLFGLGLSSKGLESNFWFSANRIVLFHWNLDPHLKWPYDNPMMIEISKDEMTMITSRYFYVMY